jgi:hypothetical protein
MQTHRNPHLKVLWEHVDDQGSTELLRQVITLVLNDHSELSTSPDIDREPPIGINEGVPVENTK